jgi:TorA maturation chaperone TorD
MTGSTDNQVGQKLPALRANAFHALARAYRPPVSWPDDLPDILTTAFLPFGGELAALSRALSTLLGQEDYAPEKLARAHARLFIGPFDIQAPPWASLYLDPEKQLMGEVSQYAAEAYAEAGLGPVEGPTDAPDELTHELEFMYFLAFQEYSTGDPVWLNRQVSFWKEHLGVWLPQFATLVDTSTDEEDVFNLFSQLTISLTRKLDAQFDISRY